MEIYYCHVTIKENPNFKLFYCIHIVETPTNKGANSYKLIFFENSE